MNYDLLIYLDEKYLVAGIPRPHKTDFLKFDGKLQLDFDIDTFDLSLRSVITAFIRSSKLKKVKNIAVVLFHSTETTVELIQQVEDHPVLKCIEVHEAIAFNQLARAHFQGVSPVSSDAIFAVLESFKSELFISLVAKNGEKMLYRKKVDKVSNDIHLDLLKQYIVEKYLGDRGDYSILSPSKVFEKVNQQEEKLKKWLLQLQQTVKPVIAHIQIEPKAPYPIDLNKREKRVKGILNGNNTYSLSLYEKIIALIEDHLPLITDVAFIGDFYGFEKLIQLFEKRKKLTTHTPPIGWNIITVELMKISAAAREKNLNKEEQARVLEEKAQNETTGPPLHTLVEETPPGKINEDEVKSEKEVIQVVKDESNIETESESDEEESPFIQWAWYVIYILIAITIVLGIMLVI